MRAMSLSGWTTLALAPMLAAASAGSASGAEPLTILVAYYSQTGHTKTMAEAVAEGAESAGGEDGEGEVVVLLKEIEQVSQDDLKAADGVALGSPVHMGDVAWPVRRALTTWSTDFGFWESRGLENKAAAVFATGALPSNGKEFTLWSLGQSLLQFGMVLTTPYGSMGASATTSRPDAGVDEAERKVAADLGKRLAGIAGRLKRGAP